MWTKSYDVTIKMKALSLNSHLVLFVFQNVTKCNLEIWSKSLAIFGSERVKKKEKQEALRLSFRKSAVLNCMEEETHSTFLLDGVRGVEGGGRSFRSYVGTRV